MMHSPPPNSPLLRALVAALLFCCTQPARCEWVDTRTVDVFTIRSEIDLSAHQGRILQQELGRLRTDIEVLLGFPIEEQPVEVNVFASQRSYQQFLSIRVPEGVSRPALFVKGADMGRVYVYLRRGVEVDLRHECTHALLHNTLAFVPMWLDEGLAEYFEVAPADRPSGNPHLLRVRLTAATRWRPDLRSLEDARELVDMDGADYRQSWAWVHYFLHGPLEARQVLSNYLHDIRTGQAPGSMSDRLTAESSSIPVDIVEHFRTWKSPSGKPGS